MREKVRKREDSNTKRGEEGKPKWFLDFDEESQSIRFPFQLFRFPFVSEQNIRSQ